MVDVLSPFSIPSPPPPSPLSNQTNTTIPMLYYTLVVMGVAAIVLAIYNIIIVKRCNRNNHNNQPQPTRPNLSSTRFENQHRNVLSSFKYKKEVVTKEEECSVCLSVYEEGEEVRKLPRCKHSFHAVCIDMWLYSHFDCPICRTPVGSFCDDRVMMIESGGSISV